MTKKKTSKRTSFRVYLSGSMANRVAEQVQAEREFAVKLFAKHDIYAADPGAAEKKLWGKSKNAKISIKTPPRIMRAFIKQDVWMIRHCDAILVMTGDHPSDGTWWEMGYAKQINIPIIMIAPKRVAGEIIGWSNFLVDDLVPDLSSAIRVIKRKYVKEKMLHEKTFKYSIKNAKTQVGKSVRDKNKKAQKRAQKVAAKKVIKEATEKTVPKKEEIKGSINKT